MPDEQQTIHDPAVQAPETLAYEPIEDEQDDWTEEPEQLPRRPRRRLLTPVPLALLAVLLIACGFIGGVLVQKGQGGTASASAGASAGFASRLAALRGAGATGAGAGAFAGLGGSSGGVTTGEVAYVRGNTLYVTDSQGNTVKVDAGAGSKVTKTVSTKPKDIHPGATVVVLGSKANNGSISATSISVSSTASDSTTGTGAGSSATGASSSAGTPTLFGPG